MPRLVCAIVLAVLCGGCGGNYILTVPDQVAPAGGDAAAVVRLQRAEIYMVALPVEGAALRFRVAGGPERGAYTDENGYAGTTVPVPNKPGRYTMNVDHMDKEGDEIGTEVSCYTLDANAPVVVIDLESLPPLGTREAAAARDALQRLATAAAIIYVTQKPVKEHIHAHQGLRQENFPDGPILTWQHEYYHIVREGTLKMPRMVFENRMVSQLPTLKKLFGGLKVGVTNSRAAARLYADAGINIIALAPMDDVKVIKHVSWETLDASIVK